MSIIQIVLLFTCSFLEYISASVVGALVEESIDYFKRKRTVQVINYILALRKGHSLEKRFPPLGGTVQLFYAVSFLFVCSCATIPLLLHHLVFLLLFLSLFHLCLLLLARSRHKLDLRHPLPRALFLLPQELLICP